jgi:hypothetical protein
MELEPQVFSGSRLLKVKANHLIIRIKKTQHYSTEYPEFGSIRPDTWNFLFCVVPL